MAAMKSSITFNFQNYNAAQENNVSKGINGPASLPATPLLSEKNTFGRCTLPSEIVEVADDQAPDLRVPHHISATSTLYENPSGNQHNLGFTPHLMPNPTGQQILRINQPDVSSLKPNMMPMLETYRPELMPVQNNHSGLVYSDTHSTGFSNCTMSHTGSSSFINQGIGSSRSEIGASNPMLKPRTGPYLPVQQHIANGSNINFSAYSMPLNTRMLDFTYSDLSNCGTLPQSGFHQTRPDLGYHSVTTSSQNNYFQSKGPQYCRTGPQMDFPSTATSHPAGSLHSEHPNGTNGFHIGSSNMAMPNSAHLEHQKSSTTEPVPGTSIPNLVVEPQVNSYKNSAILTPPNNAEPSSTPNIPPQGSELEGRPYKEMVAEEEVATNQVISENQGIDLNKTPQQKPRRRKYVPKVVIQGKKPRATKKTTPQNASEDRLKRKYERKKGVEPPAAEANEVGRPVGNSDLLTQKDASLPSNPISSTPSHPNNAANCVNKADDLPISSTLNAEFVRDKPIEVSQSSTPKSANRAARKKGSEDRPKRKYVRKKGVEPPPVETTVDANEAGRPVGTSNYITHKVMNLPSNPTANCVNKADDLPASRTLNAEVVLDKLIEVPESCTPKGLNGHNQLAEESIPCMPSVTTGLNKPIDISSLYTNTTMQNHYTVGGMSGPCKPVRRRLNFDAEEVRIDGYEQAQSLHTLNSVSVPPSRRNASTFPIANTSVQASKGIALDLNSTASQWHEVDRCFPPTPSTSIGGTDQMLGTSQVAGRNMNTSVMPSGLGSFTGYPYPVLPRYANNSIVTPASNCQMGLYKENLASHAKRNDSLISQTSNTPYSNMPSLIPDGRKRDYSALDNSTGLTGQVRVEHSPRIIETSKKIRIWNGNTNGLNVTQNNVSVLHNPSSTFPAVRSDRRISCLADAQRLVELDKRNSTKMLSFRTSEGNLPGCTSNAPRTTNTPVEVAQAVNAASKDQINQLAVSLQNSADITAALNQCVNSSGSHPCRLITSVISGKKSVTLEMLTGSGSINTTSTQPVDHIIRPHGIARSESCQGVSETATEKPLADICPQPSTPAKSPKLSPSSKSEPKRRGRPPKSENARADSLVSPRPKGRPRGKKSSLGSANLMVGGPAALDYTIDLIIQKMSGLDINRLSETVPGQPCYALVPYQSGVSDGQIVLYDEGIMKKKKRKSRAQVNLDPVTSQVWNLLMGKEMKDGIETVNENDEKKMEAEREVFRGRVDSFIARMHLVQGDRRFSPWKGSVVDSVVGVFLTQNVSDHLSSSAFMALAAKYPVETHLKNSEPRESMLMVSRPCNTNPYARDFINLTKWHRQREVIIEDFTDIASQVTTEEKDSNESQGSTTKCPGSSPEKKLTGSPDSGPGLVINFSSDDPTSESMVSSQNSVLSNQSSSDNLFQGGEQNCSGLGVFGSNTADGPVGNVSFRTPDFVGTRPTSYTQLLRMAESHRVGFSPAFSKETGAVVDVCSYSNISQLYPQNGSIYSGTSPTLNNSNISSMYPQNGIYPPSDAPAMVNGNKIDETFQTPDSEPRMRTHSPIVSRTPQPITPMIKITRASGKTNGCIPLQEEKKMCQVDSSQPPLQQPQPQAQSTPSASNLQNNPNANSYQTSKASSETVQGKQPDMVQKAMDGSVIDDGVSSKGKKGKGASGKGKKNFDWDSLRRAVLPDGVKKERTYKTMDSLDYEALRKASVSELSDAIRERGMNNMLAERIKGFLDRIVNDHGSIDLEWLRDVDPDKAKDYLLNIRGLGLKSVECVRLLTLHHMAFPVDTNVGRICVRLGWVPLQPLPESLQLHLLEMYPILENIQKYLWPRLCKLDQRTLYELHYQMITFGKVFCTKSKPNCNACPMRAECKHFASAFASARLALPAPGEKGLTATALPAGASMSTNVHSTFPQRVPPPQIEGSSTSSSSLPVPFPYPTPVNLPHANQPQPSPQSWASNGTVSPTQTQTQTKTCNEPIIEEPASPEPEPVAEKEIGAIEDAFLEEDPDEIPVIKLDVEEFTQNLKNYIQANNLEIEETNMSKAMVAISSEAASIPVPKLKNVSRLRTEHQVYELPDNHTLLHGFEPREPDDPSPYLLSIWTPGETAMSTEPPKSLCISQDVDELCDKHACARCASIKEARSKIVRGTILIPCRTAMRGSFPLNGTYFQVNEVFADHESSRTPVEISRAWIWNLPRRTVYFGTSIPTIFKGQSTEEIQHCFWRGFVCVRGFDRATRAPRPLYARLHFPASKVTRNSKKSAAAKDEV